MAKEHLIPITNGKGSKEIADGTYNVAATALGYDETTISPAEVTIETGTDEYSFTVAATGTLTLHVSDDGTDIGVPIVGAKFYRCDSEGNTYGDPVETNEEGNAVFEHIPYAEADTFPTVYYKQIESDGEHTFDAELKNIEVDSQAKTIEIQNEAAALRSFNLTDANYEGLPITDGNITITNQE